MDIIYQIIIFLLFIFSIVSSIMFYNNQKHNLMNLSSKLKNGWGLYKIQLKRDETIITSPIDQSECLYYSGNIYYEEKVTNEVERKKKKELDIRYYKNNTEKIIDNNFFIILNGKEFKVNSKNLNLEIDPITIYDVKLNLGENKEVLYLEEKILKENTFYYAMIEFNNKKINLKDITISNEKENYKNNFYFHIGLLWLPTIFFTVSYFLI